MIIFITVCLVIMAVFVAAPVAYGIYAKKNRRTGTATKKVDTAGTPRMKRPKTRSERIRLGYRYDYGSVFVHENTVWTGVKLGPAEDRLLSVEDVNMLVTSATQGLAGLVTGEESVNVQYRLTHRPFRVAEWAKQLLWKSWNPSAMYRAYIDSIATFLTHAKSLEPTAYLLVQIDALESGDLSDLIAQMDAAMLGTDDEHIPPHLAARWEGKARRVIDHLRSALDAEPITREDRMWLIRKPLYGHHSPNLSDFPLTKPWGEGEFALWVDFNAENRRKYMQTEILNSSVSEIDRNEDSSMTEAYTACLVVSDWENQIEPGQGNAWLRFFADAGLEVSVRMKVMPPKQFRARMEKINGNLRAEQKNMRDGKQEPDAHHVMEQEDAEMAVQRLKARQTVGVQLQVVVQVSAPTLDELNAAIEDVTLHAKHSSNLSIELVRPSRYQWRLLKSMLPGAPPSLPMFDTKSLGVPYTRILEPEYFGAGLPRVGTRIGDRVDRDRQGQELGWIGNYLGDTNGIPVFHSPHAATGRDSGGGVFIVGGSGGGKSSLALLMFFQASESGVQTVVLDPKTDFAQFCYYISFGPQVNAPEFAGYANRGLLGTPDCPFQPVNRTFWEETKIINVLAAEEGVLDPWGIEGTFDGGLQLADTVLSMLLTPAETNQAANQLARAKRVLRQRYDTAVAAKVAELEDDPQTAGFTAVKLHDHAERQVELPTLWQLVDIVTEGYATFMAGWGHAEQATPLSGDDARYRDEQEATASVLESIRKAQYARLAFGKKPARLDVSARRRTVFTLSGLQLPSNDVELKDMNSTQRSASAVMYLLVRMATILLEGSADKTRGDGSVRPKMLFVDESYVVTAVQAGQQMLQKTLAQGRSTGLITVLIDQLATRLAQIESNSESDTASTNQVEAIFSFQQRSQDDAEKVAPLLTKKNREGMATSILPERQGGLLSTGVCLYRDMDSDIAKLRVDLLFLPLLRASETNPAKRASAQSHPISADPAEWAYILDEDRATSVAEDSAQTADPVPHEPAVTIEPEETLVEAEQH